MIITKHEFHSALDLMIDSFGRNKLGAEKVRSGVSMLESEVEKLKEQLAAAQAVVAKKDEALAECVSKLESQIARNDNLPQSYREVLKQSFSALDLPSDDTALRSILAEKHREIAAAQAVIAQKNEAMRAVASMTDGLEWRICDAAISIPSDDTALREVINAKLEEAAVKCEQSDRYRGEYFAAKVRELKKQRLSASSQTAIAGSILLRRSEN